MIEPSLDDEYDDDSNGDKQSDARYEADVHRDRLVCHTLGYSWKMERNIYIYEQFI